MLDDKMKEIVKEIFNNYDENQNGVLDRMEFFKGFTKLLKSLVKCQSAISGFLLR